MKNIKQAGKLREVVKLRFLVKSNFGKLFLIKKVKEMQIYDGNRWLHSHMLEK